VSRTLQLDTIQQLYGSESSMVLPVLIEITYYDVNGNAIGPIYLANNNVDLAYGGHTYLASSFLFTPPEETGEGVTEASITVCNVDRSLMVALRDSTIPPLLTARAMFYYNPSGVLSFEQIAAWPMTLRSAQATSEVITATLKYDDNSDDEMGPIEFTPYTTPGLF
jgi:hypothetical protein